MKNNPSATVPFVSPSEEDIREYAYHLYLQNGCQAGHDVDNWLEAKACLCASIPPVLSRTRLHHHAQKSAPGISPPKTITA